MLPDCMATVGVVAKKLDEATPLFAALDMNWDCADAVGVDTSWLEEKFGDLSI